MTYYSDYNASDCLGAVTALGAFYMACYFCNDPATMDISLVLVYIGVLSVFQLVEKEYEILETQGFTLNAILLASVGLLASTPFLINISFVVIIINSIIQMIRFAIEKEE